MPASITPLEAAGRLESDPHTIYLDVRSTPEFAAGHPPGAYNIPLLEPDPESGMLMPNPHFVTQVAAIFDPATPIIAGCRSGVRSLQAGTLLQQAGYAQIWNLLGGFLGAPGSGGNPEQPGWVNTGLPIEEHAQEGRDFASLRIRAQNE